ncbi:MAG TPA: ABC transporter substrate-binding protein [Intrasporangiaceae bacterium]|nr:ABC transporter substrate-binding protein [Intrasporangiaceae bacterium]
MRKPHPISKAFALAAAGALVLAGCSAVDDTPSGGDTSPGATDAATDGGTDAAPTEIKIGDGVTEEACPNAVNPDNGCIYLGILSDLTEGPFAALAVPIVDGQRAYWKTINEAGGIAGYDIDIDTYTRDTKYQAAEHAQAYQQIEPNILALAQTLGTVNTEAILDDMDAADIVGVPASWWSGYAFTENDYGLILENGYSYCTEAIVALDWFTENHAKPTKVAAVGYPGDYGGDSAAGVQKWADVNEGTEVTVVPTGPNQVTGNQDAVVSAVAAASPDVVVLAVGPAETAEIVGKLAAGGFQGRFLGALPTWNPALLQSAAAPALKAMYNHVAPGEQWSGTSEGVKEMKEAANNTAPANGGYIIGWLMSVPMHAVLETAAEKGDLTRAGVRAAVSEAEADYKGMSTNQSYGGEGKDVAVSRILMMQPDESDPMGEVAVGDFYEGPSWDKVDYSAACVATG